MDINVISIMSNTTKEIHTFTYFDSIENVRTIARLIYKDNDLAVDTTIDEFINKKNEIYRNAYFNYMKKVRDNNLLALIDSLNTKIGQINIMIYDSNDEVISKYAKAFGRKLKKEEKIKVLNNFNTSVHKIIDEFLINEKGKIK